MAQQQQQGSSALQAIATGENQSKGALATLQGYFVKHRSQLEMALPKHLNADRMIRLSLTAFSQNPKLMECDPKTVFGSIVTASQLGLEIGVVGQGYLVPYKRTCQFIPGWQGFVDLVSRSGRATVWTGAVFDGDEFDYSLGDRPYVKHKPCGEDNPKKLTHTYAVGRVNGSEWPVIEVWPIKKVWKHRDKVNKVGDRHYSFEHPEMYARKVPLLQVCKYMPKSVELTNALTIAHAAEEGRGATLDGDFVKLEDGPEVNETDTGDNKEPKGAKAAERKPPANDGAPTIKDALALVNAGKYDDASDMVKGPAFTDVDRREIAVATEKHKKGEKV